MALITDAAETWSAPVTLAADEIWQVRAGSAFLTTTASADPDDGFRLTAGEGVLIRAGRDVRYRAGKGDGPCLLVREGV